MSWVYRLFPCKDRVPPKPIEVPAVEEEKKPTVSVRRRIGDTQEELVTVKPGFYRLVDSEEVIEVLVNTKLVEVSKLQFRYESIKSEPYWQVKGYKEPK